MSLLSVAREGWGEGNVGLGSQDRFFCDESMYRSQVQSMSKRKHVGRWSCERLNTGTGAGQGGTAQDRPCAIFLPPVLLAVLVVADA